jgi:ketosteroid isomerase-like protein
MPTRTRIAIACTLLALTARIASSADATSVARAHSEAFARACGSGNVAAVVALYDDDAIAIWPGQGEEAVGKAAIGKLAAGLCNGKDKPPVLKSIEGHALGKGYVVTNGRWELTTKAPDGTSAVALIRTTEVLKESGGHWRYVVDHASIGIPPSTPPH